MENWDWKFCSLWPGSLYSYVSLFAKEKIKSACKKFANRQQMMSPKDLIFLMISIHSYCQKRLWMVCLGFGIDKWGLPNMTSQPEEGEWRILWQL